MFKINNLFLTRCNVRLNVHELILFPFTKTIISFIRIFQESYFNRSVHLIHSASISIKWSFDEKEEGWNKRKRSCFAFATRSKEFLIEETRRCLNKKIDSDSMHFCLSILFDKLSRALGWVFLDQSPSKVTSYFASSQAQHFFRTCPWSSASALESWHIFSTKFWSSMYHVSGVSNIVALWEKQVEEHVLPGPRSRDSINSRCQRLPKWAKLCV